MVPCGNIICNNTLEAHSRHVATNTTITEYFEYFSAYISKIFIIPNRIKESEKNMLIALIATTNSVAEESIYEYHFQVVGTKKCHIPNPIDIILPNETSIFVNTLLICYTSSFILIRTLFPIKYSLLPRARSAGLTSRLTCEAELARILHEDFSRIRDKQPSQVEAFVRC